MTRAGVVRGAVCAAAAMAALCLLPASASAALTCGSTLTASVSLTQDLSCPSTATALTLGKAAITVNLNGYTITAGSIGISDSGFNGVTVKNGSIAAPTGVRFQGVSNGRVGSVSFCGCVSNIGVVARNGSGNTFTRLTSDGLLTLVQLGSETGDTISDNWASGSSRAFVDLLGTNNTFLKNYAEYDTNAGYWCDGCSGDHFTSNRELYGDTGFADSQPSGMQTYASNVATQPGVGFDLSDGAFTLQNNTVTAPDGSGILIEHGYLVDDDGETIGSTITGNVVGDADDTGIAIEVIRGATISGNTVTNSNGNGIEVFNPAEVDFPTTVTNNTANGNYGFGILSYQDVTTGTGNVARNNGVQDCAGVPCQAPVNRSLPVISGSPVAGQRLTATQGVWTISKTGRSFAFQWQRCDSAGANCVDVPGANTSKYLLTDADNAATIRVSVAATDDNGATAATSAATAAVTVLPPVNSSSPTIAGSPVDGQVLTAGIGTWTGSPGTYSYQWLRCDSGGANCSSIGGATSSKYTITPAEIGNTIGLQVTSTNVAGNASATAAPTAVVQGAPPVNTAAPTISGTLNAGYTLTAKTGKWQGTPTIAFTYQWYDCDASCTPISGANNSTYRLTDADVGFAIAVDVTGTNSYGSATATSAQTSAVDPGVQPNNVVAPALSGTAVDGGKLTVTKGTWTGSPVIVITYQWYRCDETVTTCVAVGGATGSSYTLTPADVGSRIQVQVTGTNDYGTFDPPRTGPSDVVAPTPPTNSVAPTVTASGNVATGHRGTWNGPRPVNFTYQWLVCDSDGTDCSSVGGATGTTLTFDGTYVGKSIRFQVTATNPDGSTSVTSDAYVIT